MPPVFGRHLFRIKSYAKPEVHLMYSSEINGKICLLAEIED